MNALLIFFLLLFTPNLALGFGIITNFFSSLLNSGKYGNTSVQGASNAEPSIPNPVPILNANLTSNLCGPQVVCCVKTRYRSLNGSCNNLENPGWGTPNSTYLRLLPPSYADGLYKIQTDLPNARELSAALFPDKKTNDDQLNLNAMQWGQIITHDMSLFADVSDQIKTPPVCCDNGQLTKQAQDQTLCAPVTIPKNDPFYGSKGIKCLELTRAGTDRNIGCVPENQPANQINVVTAAMDASIVYGSTDEQGAAIRAFKNGNLKTVTRHGREWPPQVNNVTQTCSGARSPKEPCYLGGDVRINQNTELTLLQIIFIHYHNYIADYLSEINPHWDDEKIYQEARRILIAVYQNINYYEYLPYLLGKEYMLANKLIYPRTKANLEEYINDYDPNLVLGVITEHTTAALRYFHTFIQGYLMKKNEYRKNEGELRLSDWFNRPLVLEEKDTFDQLVYGFTAQSSSVADPFFSVEITEYLFRNGNYFGGDLRSVDIQRDRDMSLGKYVQGRAACNLTVPKTWDELRGIIAEIYIIKLKKMYKDVCDIDLTVGGSLESHVPGARAGPLFLCIMLAQFHRARKADRFYYENGKDKQTAFAPDQLKNIRSITMASFLCASTEAGNMQKWAFEIVSLTNPILSCDDIPSLNLDLWKEASKPEDEEGYGGENDEDGDNDDNQEYGSKSQGLCPVKNDDNTPY
ncbi:peroxidase-like [Aricia agestis]|uniref:peroxidase-like n=1 Tax=Aricia agestis TaxID=91739 RepID=UPI001C206E34|nr:peroxidase-like [Aricia agestis]